MRGTRAATPLVALVMMLASTIGVSGAASDEALGVFRLSGSLAEGRWGPTATLLEDGRVLVVGGSTRPTITHRPVVEWAELWDPATETFSEAGRLGRESHTATLLPDGRVLIIGGNQPQRSLASARLWDPATASFERAGSLEEARASHTATLLPDGRVLVVGGWVRDGPSGLRSAEIWDPVTRSFAPIGPLIEARGNHTATLLDDGRVLILGGDADKAVIGNELWDPATGTFGSAGPVGRLLGGHTATLLPDGRVLVVGGYGVEGEYQANAVFWGSDDESFTSAGTPLCGRYAHTATLLPGGRVLIVGGIDPDSVGASLRSAELWDPATGMFVRTGSLGESRGGHAATLLPDGRVLIVGGARWRDEMSLEAELWEVASDSAVLDGGVPACIPYRESFSPGQ